jgi:C4-dicarboxylate transporter DctM subunit
MTTETVIILVVSWFTIFLLLGQSVATVMLGAGLLGTVLLKNTAVLNGLVGPDVFFTTSSYTLSIIPLYLLMAQVLVKGGVFLDLFRVGHRLAGYRRFPLGVATIMTGGMLGAVSGSGAASAAAISTLATPELQRVGYSREFAVAVAAVAGSLSVVIPPSLLVMIYGSVTGAPIGKLFMGSIGPSVLCILVYILCLWLFGGKQQVTSAQLRQDAIAEPIVTGRSVVAAIFVVTLMTIVFGSIYGGVVTVGEAGAIGAFTALVGMIAMRRVTLADIGQALVDSVKISAMLTMLLVAAQIFSRFLSFSRIPAELLQMAAPLIDQPELLVVVIMLGFFIAGMALEEITIIVLSVPILLPMIEAAGIDPIWFGVVSCYVISLGLLTPPVGLVAFSAATAARTPVGPVFRIALNFTIVAAVLVVGSLMVFPQIVTWLPSHLK